MKLDKHVVDMFTELTKPADDVKMEKTCYGTISVVDGTRYVKLDGSDLLVPAASTVKTSHGDRVTVLMKNHSLTVTGNLTAPATDGEGGSSGEAGTAATIEVGTVTTGEAGSSASITNSGTTSAAVFDFVIPRGDKGEKGDTGPQGPQGEKGDTGTWDGTIPDHEHTVSDITDFPNFALAENKFLDDFFSSKSGDIRALVIDLPSGGFGGNTDRLPNITGFPITGDILITWSKSVYSSSNGFRYGTLQVRSMTQSNLPVYQCSVYNDGVYTDWQKLCDGGNSDTVDGLHASDLFQKSEGLRSGILYYDIFSTTLNSDHPCWNKHCCVVGQSANPDASDYIDNAPESNTHALWYEVFTCGLGNRAYQIAFGCFGHQRKTFIRYKHDNAWSDWKNIADAGNADTLDGLHANEIASNPNLLINPDFKINQRGLSEYADARIYCVDRWYKPAVSNMTVTKLSSGISFSSDNVSDHNWIVQKLEEMTFAEDTAVTLSVCAKGSFGITYYGDGMHNFAADNYTIKSLTYIIPAGKRFGTDISYCPLIGLSATGEYAEFLWAKLELGGIATPFVLPDPATELAKCQRYYQKIRGQNAIFGSGFISGSTTACIIVPISPMRIKPTLTFAGTAHIWAVNHMGSNSYNATFLKLDEFVKNGNSVGVEFSLNAATGSIGQGCTIQFRDVESYLELSAEL